VTAARRLPQGGRIDRLRPLAFTFNGRPYQGFAGDTLASALLANGVTLVARSWKYHRPRGIVAAGVEEPNAVVQLETGAHAVPNARATEVLLYEGLSARSVNCWPGPEIDLMAPASLFSGLMPAGFYYKTFMWPKRLWMRYEHFIRRASGMGEAPGAPDPSTYDKMNAHCDVLVAGAGPAGLAAALAAARSGARVILADEQAELGGSLLALSPSTATRIDGQPPAAWLEAAQAQLRAMPNVRVLVRSTVFGYHDGNFLTIAERRHDHLRLRERDGRRERIWRVRARQVVLATGAIERPLVFANNDRPGIMLASAAAAYVNRYGVRFDGRAVVFTNNDSAYRCALDLARAGIPVAAVVDSRRVGDSVLARQVREAGIEIVDNAVVVDARGGRRLAGVEVMALDGERVAGKPRLIECGLLAMSGGWSPVVHLHAQSGARPRFDPARACFVPGESVQQERSVGACNARFGLAACIAEGGEGGAQAARRAGFAAAAANPPAVEGEALEEQALEPLWLVPSPHGPGRGPKQFVDFQSDVSAADIALAAREGYRSIEHVKRYTALGFGTDQGKLGNINGMAILARALGNDLAATGTTTFRPNYTPVTFGALAGRDLGELFEPVRKTALHAWHEAHGAVFENVGQWKRPWYFPMPGETMAEAVRRECLAAREGVAIMDASTFGKIDIKGPDAAAFLDLVYTNAWTKLGIGRCRYGLMLDENGMVMDDGVTTRLAEHHYLMTTTTGGAARVLAWLERWLQTEWPHLRVYLTSVTDHFATAAVVGPRSGEVLRALCADIDFSPAAFPFMAYRPGTVAGVAARVMRISFSGELAYEVNVPANEARHVWEALMAAGEPHGITPYGTEAMHVLRAEKGYIIVGQDTDGSVTPLDLGMAWIVSGEKDFIGRRSLARSHTARTDRKQLVGLLTEDPGEVLAEGAQLVADAAAAVPVPMLGHVTSSYASPALGRSIALAMLQGGASRMGQVVQAMGADGRAVAARVASPVFLDRGQTLFSPGAGADVGSAKMIPERPVPESPLARLRPDAGVPGDSSGIEVFERPFLGHIDIRGDGNDARFAAAVADVLGIALPMAANTVATGRHVVACWLGPDEWLVITPPRREGAIAAALRDALGGLHASVTEVGSGQTVLVLRGAAVRELLSKECPLDLHGSSFAPGACAQTRLAKCGILLRPLEGDAMELIVRRSFADYLWTWLEDAGAEYGLHAIREPAAAPAARVDRVLP
jgi:sarcosine oxidase, subunit alpha